MENFEWRKMAGENKDKKVEMRLVRTRTSTIEDEDVLCRYIGMSWFRKNETNVIGTMEFTGTGATGELGNRWYLMVALSLLRIVNEQMYWNELGAVMKSGSGVALKAAKLATKIGVEVAMNV